MYVVVTNYGGMELYIPLGFPCLCISNVSRPQSAGRHPPPNMKGNSLLEENMVETRWTYLQNGTAKLCTMVQICSRHAFKRKKQSWATFKWKKKVEGKCRWTKALFRKLLEDTIERTWIAQYRIDNPSSYTHMVSKASCWTGLQQNSFHFYWN